MASEGGVAGAVWQQLVFCDDGGTSSAYVVAQAVALAWVAPSAQALSMAA